MLVNGRHYCLFPKNSDTLVVSYAPVELVLGQLPHYKRLASLDVDRLAINPGTDNFYQDCLDEVSALIGETSRRYRRVIHYGFSAGAYAALRFGADDPAASAIFAMSPHINLKRPATRSTRCIKTFSPAPDDWDLTDRINRASCPAIYMIHSCNDMMDGAQIRDSEKIYNKNVTKLYYTLPHELPGVNAPLEVLSHFLETGAYRELAADFIASPETRNDSILCYRLYRYLLDGGENIDDIDLTGRLTSQCGMLAYMQARVLHARGRLGEALLKYTEAIVILQRNRCHLGEVFFCMGNNLLDLRLDEIAFGAYRESTSRNENHIDAHRVFAREAARRSRFEEVRFVMRQHAENYGRTPALEAMEREL